MQCTCSQKQVIYPEVHIQKPEISQVQLKQEANISSGYRKIKRDKIHNMPMMQYVYTWLQCRGSQLDYEE